MKPRLPPEIVDMLPTEIVHLINTYVPHLPKPKTPPSAFTVSPNMERDLRAIQKKHLRGKNEMYLRELDGFVL